jgi:hypothetical protein
MASIKTRKNAVFKRNTRKAKKGGKVLDVRSKSHVKMFENMVVKGPLTLVFAKLEGCGPCEQFNKNVWSPLTKLKNRGMNMASIESKMIENTSLASVPRKFYPTLLLVGPDKKPATFLDESGQPTNAMPRGNTLEEDMKSLSALVKNPSVANASVKINTEKMMNNKNNANENSDNDNSDNNNSVNENSEANENSVNENTEANENSVNENTEANEPVVERSISRLPVPIPARDSPKREMKYGASPFDEDDAAVPSLMNSLVTAKSPIKVATAKSGAPDVAADIIVSTKPSLKTATAAIVNEETDKPMKGGFLLKAIRRENDSLKAVLEMRNRKSNKQRQYTRKL